MREEVLCAAIWYHELETPYSLNCVNVDKGVVLCGHRHGHIIQQLRAISGLRTCSLGENASGSFTQGFLTSKNRFLDRKEACELFIYNGGKPEFEQLYSEDLY